MLHQHFHTAISWTSLGLDPVVFTFHGFALRWYSLAYIFGLLGGWWYLLRLADAGDAPFTHRQIGDFIFWAMVGIICGGRLGYALFYDGPRFSADPLAVFRPWEGGMSFHGGLAGLILAITLFCRVQGLSALRVCDYVACVAPFGQGLGRLANFTNGELWGRVTGSDYGMIFPRAGPLPRYPSQLYEAGLEGLFLLLLLGWLFWRTNARHYPGLLLGTGLSGFGLLRFGIEFFRQPDAQLGYLALGLTMGQWLCVPMVLLGGWLMLASRNRRAKMT